MAAGIEKEEMKGVMLVGPALEKTVTQALHSPFQPPSHSSPQFPTFSYYQYLGLLLRHYTPFLSHISILCS